MTQNLEREPRPTSRNSQDPINAPTGMNRQRLAMTLSIAALLVSLASAGVHLFTFFAGGRDLMMSEIVRNQFESKVKEIEGKWVAENNRIRNELLATQKLLIEEQIKTERTMQGRNRAQASLAATQQVSAEVDARVQREVVAPVIPDLSRGARSAATGDSRLLLGPPNAKKDTFGSPKSPKADIYGPKIGNNQ